MEPLGYCLVFHTLSRGRICFKFRSRENLNKNFNKMWGWGPSSLVLKEWSVVFDPARDPKAPTKVWAILPNLPLIFWHADMLRAIGKKIGKFCNLGSNWETKLAKRWAWLQVEDFREGLQDEIELVWQGFSWLQRIDY
jgi:hypothetical protein